MGYIVYSETTGRAERYYKLERTAKAQATRMNKEIQSPWRERETFAHCSYAAYEGVLQGLKGDNLRFWQWMNGR
jgi:hypothetical protein